MGIYINPDNGTKEEFLSKFGEKVSSSRVYNLLNDEQEFTSHIGVCLMDNGPFTAACVITDYREFQSVTLPSDKRRKEWYILSREIAAQAVPEIYKEEIYPKGYKK